LLVVAVVDLMVIRMVLLEVLVQVHYDTILHSQ
jgi:hypothetical protein